MAGRNQKDIVREARAAAREICSASKVSPDDLYEFNRLLIEGLLGIEVVEKRSGRDKIRIGRRPSVEDIRLLQIAADTVYAALVRRSNIEDEDEDGVGSERDGATMVWPDAVKKRTLSKKEAEDMLFGLNGAARHLLRSTPSNEGDKDDLSYILEVGDALRRGNVRLIIAIGIGAIVAAGAGAAIWYLLRKENATDDDIVSDDEYISGGEIEAGGEIEGGGEVE